MKIAKQLTVCLPLLLVSLGSTSEIQAGKFAQLVGFTTLASFVYCGCKIAKDNEHYRLTMDKNLRALTDRLNKNSNDPKIVLEQYNPPADKVFQVINAGLVLSSKCMVIASGLLNDLSSTVFKSNSVESTPEEPRCEKSTPAESKPAQ